MSKNVICPQCGGEMESGSQPNQYACPYCGEIITQKEVEDVTPKENAPVQQQQVVSIDASNQQSAPNIKVEVVMPESKSFIERIKENNQKLLKIVVIFSIAIAIFVFIGKHNESLLGQNASFFNPTVTSKSQTQLVLMLFGYIASWCLGIYLALLIIGAAIVKRNKSKEEIKELSLTYPSKKLQIILFSIFVALPIAFFIMICLS